MKRLLNLIILFFAIFLILSCSDSNKSRTSSGTIKFNYRGMDFNYNIDYAHPPLGYECEAEIVKCEVNISAANNSNGYGLGMKIVGPLTNYFSEGNYSGYDSTLSVHPLIIVLGGNDELLMFNNEDEIILNITRKSGMVYKVPGEELGKIDALEAEFEGTLRGEPITNGTIKISFK
jgi:hypothetical protein